MHWWGFWQWYLLKRWRFWQPMFFSVRNPIVCLSPPPWPTRTQIDWCIKVCFSIYLLTAPDHIVIKLACFTKEANESWYFQQVRCISSSDKWLSETLWRKPWLIGHYTKYIRPWLVKSSQSQASKNCPVFNYTSSLWNDSMTNITQYLTK